MRETLIKKGLEFAVYLCSSHKKEEEWIEKRAFDNQHSLYLIEREKRALAMLEGSISPRLMPSTSEQLSVSMQYLGRRSLKVLIQSAHMSRDDKATLCVHLIRTVKAMHHAGIAHLDLAPENIFLAADKLWGLGLIDFSYCGFRRELPFLRPINTFAGHMAYASPEQLGLGDPYICESSDLYSLGLIIREIFGAQDHLHQDLEAARDIRKQKLSVKMVAARLVLATEGLLSLDLQARQAAIAHF